MRISQGKENNYSSSIWIFHFYTIGKEVGYEKL